MTDRTPAAECERTAERLVDYLDGASPPDEREALEAHAARCAECAALVRESRAILAAYRSVPDDDVGGDVAERVRAAARTSAPYTAPRRARRVTWILAAAAAAALVAAAALFYRRERAPDPLARLMGEAKAQLDAGAADDALASYERALQLAGDDERRATILHRLAELHFARAGFAEALGEIARLIAARPDYPELDSALLLRARALEAVGEHEEALAVYRAIAAEFPSAREEASRRLAELQGLDADSLEALQGLGYAGGD